MPTLSPRAVESRAARARRTDQLVLDAAVGVAADDGWPGLTHLRVADRAGVSRAPLHDRYVDHSALVGALAACAAPDRTLQAATELLVGAAFDAQLRTAISETLGAVVRSWCTSRPPHITRSLAARRAYLLDLGLGLLLLGRLPGDRQL